MQRSRGRGLEVRKFLSGRAARNAGPGAGARCASKRQLVVFCLALFGVPNDLASSYAIAFHATTFLPIILLGAWSLARTPVALSDLRAARPT